MLSNTGIEDEQKFQEQNIREKERQDLKAYRIGDLDIKNQDLDIRKKMMNTRRKKLEMYATPEEMARIGKLNKSSMAIDSVLEQLEAFKEEHPEFGDYTGIGSTVINASNTMTDQKTRDDVAKTKGSWETSMLPAILQNEGVEANGANLEHIVKTMGFDKLSLDQMIKVGKSERHKMQMVNHKLSKQIGIDNVLDLKDYNEEEMENATMRGTAKLQNQLDNAPLTARFKDTKTEEGVRHNKDLVKNALQKAIEINPGNPSLEFTKEALGKDPKDVDKHDIEALFTSIPADMAVTGALEAGIGASTIGEMILTAGVVPEVVVAGVIASVGSIAGGMVYRAIQGDPVLRKNEIVKDALLGGAFGAGISGIGKTLKKGMAWGVEKNLAEHSNNSIITKLKDQISESTKKELEKTEIASKGKLENIFKDKEKFKNINPEIVGMFKRTSKNYNETKNASESVYNASRSLNTYENIEKISDKTGLTKQDVKLQLQTLEKAIHPGVAKLTEKSGFISGLNEYQHMNTKDMIKKLKDHNLSQEEVQHLAPNIALSTMDEKIAKKIEKGMEETEGGEAGMIAEMAHHSWNFLTGILNGKEKIEFLDHFLATNRLLEKEGLIPKNALKNPGLGQMTKGTVGLLSRIARYKLEGRM